MCGGEEGFLGERKISGKYSVNQLVRDQKRQM